MRNRRANTPKPKAKSFSKKNHANNGVEHSAGGVVVAPDGESVLLAHSLVDKGGWVLPKGHFKKSDRTLPACAKREVMEETGLDRRDQRVTAWLDDTPELIQSRGEGGGGTKITRFFLVRASTRNLRNPIKSPDHDKAAWVLWDDISSLPLRYVYILEIVQKARELLTGKRISDRAQREQLRAMAGLASLPAS